MVAAFRSRNPLYFFFKTLSLDTDLMAKLLLAKRHRKEHVKTLSFIRTRSRLRPSPPLASKQKLANYVPDRWKIKFFTAVQSCHRASCTIRKHRRDEDAWGFTHLEDLVYIFRGIIESIFRLNFANKKPK